MTSRRMLSIDKLQKLHQFTEIRHHDILVDQLSALYLVDIDYRLFKLKLESLQKSYKRIRRESFNSQYSLSSSNHLCPESPLLADQIMLQLIYATFDQIDRKHLEYFEKQWKSSGGVKRFVILFSDLILRSEFLIKSTTVWVKEVFSDIKEFFCKIGEILFEPLVQPLEFDEKHEKASLLQGGGNRNVCVEECKGGYKCVGGIGKCTKSDCVYSKFEAEQDDDDVYSQIIDEIDHALKEVKFEFFFSLKYHELFIDQLILIQMLDPNYHYPHSHYQHHMEDEFSHELADHHEDYKHRELLERQQELVLKRSEVEEGYKEFINALQLLLPQLCNESRIVRSRANSYSLPSRSRANSYSLPSINPHGRTNSYSHSPGNSHSRANSDSQLPKSSHVRTNSCPQLSSNLRHRANSYSFGMTSSEEFENDLYSTNNCKGSTYDANYQVYSCAPVSPSFGSYYNSNYTSSTTNNSSPVSTSNSPTHNTDITSIRTSISKEDGFLTFTSADWFLLVLVKVTGQRIEEQLDLLEMTEEEEAQWVEFRRLYQLLVGLFHSLTGH